MGGCRLVALRADGLRRWLRQTQLLDLIDAKSEAEAYFQSYQENGLADSNLEALQEAFYELAARASARHSLKRRVIRKIINVFLSLLNRLGVRIAIIKIASRLLPGRMFTRLRELRH